MRIKALNENFIKNESDGCLLCHNALCTNKCPNGHDPARVIRALRFENTSGAVEVAAEVGVCSSCKSKSCVRACIKGRIDQPVRIPQLMEYAGALKNSASVNAGAVDNQSGNGLVKTINAQVDLGIEFCGKHCENPFFLSSSVVSSNYEMVARAFKMGWAGAAFKTIGTFVPDEVSPRFSSIRKEGNSFIGFKNIEQISDHTLEENLDYLRRLKKDFPGKILIASILGQNEEEWTYLAKCVTDAGVDIIECNFSCPHMTGEGLGSDVGQNPDMVALFTAAVKKGTHLPVLVKMTPNIGNMEIPALAAMKAGADGIAAINTIKSIMNIDLEDFVSGPKVDGKSCVGGYSGKTVKPVALRFIHDIKKHPELKDVPVSGMGGIETWRDAAEFIALGCANLQVTTSVMQYGYRIIEDLIKGLSHYLIDQGFSSVQQLVGVALPNLVAADQLNRHSISYPKFNRSKCLGCGRCYLSCLDGGHQALEMDEAAGKPKLIPDKCTGCQLCVVVCPAGAITAGKRLTKQ